MLPHKLDETGVRMAIDCLFAFIAEFTNESGLGQKNEVDPIYIRKVWPTLDIVFSVLDWKQHANEADEVEYHF